MSEWEQLRPVRWRKDLEEAQGRETTKHTQDASRMLTSGNAGDSRCLNTAFVFCLLHIQITLFCILQTSTDLHWEMPAGSPKRPLSVSQCYIISCKQLLVLCAECFCAFLQCVCSLQQVTECTWYSLFEKTLREGAAIYHWAVMCNNCAACVCWYPLYILILCTLYISLCYPASLSSRSSPTEYVHSGYSITQTWVTKVKPMKVHWWGQFSFHPRRFYACITVLITVYFQFSFTEGKIRSQWIIAEMLLLHRCNATGALHKWPMS